MQYSDFSSRCWASQKGHLFAARGFRLIFLLFLGIVSGIGYGFDILGDRIHSLSHPALALNIMGHVDIGVTHVVPHNLRPCAARMA